MQAAPHSREGDMFRTGVSGCCARQAWVLGLALLAGPVQAALDGTVLAVQTTRTWFWGPLVLIDVPSMQKRVVVADPHCMGPCISPDGARIAYIKAADDYELHPGDELHIVNVDGTGDIATGVKIPQSNVTWACASLYWLDLDNEMGQGEYIYWMKQDETTGAPLTEHEGVFRWKIGSAPQAREKLINDYFFWGGFSTDGRRASGTRNDWSVYTIDLTTLTWIKVYGGCNSSVSPDGKYLLQNLNRGPWDATYEHTHCMVRVAVYGNEDVFGVSGVFAIVAPTAATRGFRGTATVTPSARAMQHWYSLTGAKVTAPAAFGSTAAGVQVEAAGRMGRARLVVR